MPVTISGSGSATGVTSVPNLQSFPTGPQLAAANMPAGSVVQIVTATAAYFSTTSGSLTATGLSANITPQFASSKILIMVALNPSSNNTTEVDGALFRNGSSLSGDYWWDQYSAGGASITSGTMTYYDSPATTSPINYAMYLRSPSPGGTIKTGGSSQNQLMLLMEIR